jgi:putative intracellular protease/amidase
MAALDAIGPFEVLAHLPDATVTWVGLDVGVKRTEEGKAGVGIHADVTIEELPHPDVIVVPGGHGEQKLRSDERFLSWLRAAHETSTWTTSVCTGSLLLGAAGLLEGKRATSHWIAGDIVAQTIQLGIEYDPQPPFDAGSPLKAPEFAVDFLRESSRFLLTGEK